MGLSHFRTSTIYFIMSKNGFSFQSTESDQDQQHWSPERMKLRGPELCWKCWQEIEMTQQPEWLERNVCVCVCVWWECMWVSEWMNKWVKKWRETEKKQQQDKTVRETLRALVLVFLQLSAPPCPQQDRRWPFISFPQAHSHAHTAKHTLNTTTFPSMQPVLWGFLKLWEEMPSNISICFNNYH